MKRAVILHGTGGSPESNWFRWLDSELRHHNYEVWLPTLPNSDRPSLKDNAEFFRKNAPFEIDNMTLLIGHSSGAILALIIAQEYPAIGDIVAVSVFRDEPSEAVKWEANSRLFDVDFEFDSIKDHSRSRLFVHSDNDPYVPLGHAKYLADQTDGELIVLPGQGHFNLENSPSYSKFPKLIELMEARHIL